MTRLDYLSQKAEDVADENVVIVSETTSIADAARIMRKEELSSILVGQDSSHVVGIVTEKDILYRVVAENKGPFKVVLREVMSSPLVTLDAAAQAKDGVELMLKKGIRRLPIIKQGRVIGIMTLRSVVGNDINKNVELPELELPGKNGVVCPYCHSRFESKEDLSKHIDRLHLGSGLLEGDLRQW
jgi:signal-transduction protein with cAMP-binding, CBS, and nucleotidyltransferase domain